MWTNDTILDDPVVESNLRGFVTFAKSAAPNSRTTQLFINYGDNSNLDAMGFSPFGVVTIGIESVDAINPEYGQTPNQGLINSDGNDYLDANFPNLDSITTARVVP
jgi:cyclophilin family peptidyl-prolyl cis-trans isomerase